MIVCFGTGKFLGVDDFSTTQIQTIYGVWDYGDSVFQPVRLWSTDDDSEYLGTFREPKKAAQLSNQPDSVKLLKQKASEVIVGPGVIARVLTAEKPVWAITPDPDKDQLPDLSDKVPNDAGWYLDLDVYSGERVITDVLLRDRHLDCHRLYPRTKLLRRGRRIRVYGIKCVHRRTARRRPVRYQ